MSDNKLSLIAKSVSFNVVKAGLKDPNMLYVEFVLVSSGRNENGHVFLKDELKKSIETPIGKPVLAEWIDWDGDGLGDPMGHVDRAIGVILDSRIEDNDEGGIDMICIAGIWKHRFPADANNIKALFAIENLFFSMEVEPEKTANTDDGLELYELNFVGAAIVPDPANPRSKALLVARKTKGDDIMGDIKITDMEEFKTMLAEKVDKVNDLSNEVKDLKGKLEAAEARAKDAEGKLSTMSEKIEAAREKAKAQERFDEMSSFVDYEDDEKETVLAELGGMDEKTYNTVKATAEKASSKKDDKENDQDTVFASLTSGSGDDVFDIFAKYADIED